MTIMQIETAQKNSYSDSIRIIWKNYTFIRLYKNFKYNTPTKTQKIYDAESKQDVKTQRKVP